MRVANREIKEQAATIEVSAEVDGYRLWYRVPKSYAVSKSGDAFLASALLPAMRQGEKLEIDASMPVSLKLLENAFRLQEIFHSWNPEELKIIPIDATTSPVEPLHAGGMSFFSGGVDSEYTFLKRKEEISHVVFMHGFDFYANNGDGPAFSVGDIRDLGQFAYRLMMPWNALYAFLQGMLSKTTLHSLSNYRISGSDPGMVETALIRDLNSLIAGPVIYESQRFNGVNLRPQTKQLLEKNPQGEDVKVLNRFLLEDACPQEISSKSTGTFKMAIERNTHFIQSFGKALIPVEHNHYPFGYRYNLSRLLTQGSVLASVGLLLGFHRVYVPSAFSYTQLIPLGSHPLIDPLWSNDCPEIIHDGCEARRTEKIEKICESESALANLRVCFQDMNINCGKCEKCLRTMIPLKLLGVSDAPFPPLPTAGIIRKSHIPDEIEKSFFRESIDLAVRSGDQEMLDALYRCLRRNERRQLLVEFDRVFLNGIIKKAYRKIVKIPGGNRRVNTTMSK